MILKNEEKNLETLMESLRSEVKEIVLVDTGSTDGTIDLAKKWADQFHQIEWRDDFAWARNQALAKASENWVLSLDADHRLDSFFWKEMDELLQNPQAQAYAFLSRNYVRQEMSDTQSLDQSAPSFVKNQNFTGFVDNYQAFFMKNHLGIEWEGIVHETFLPKARRLGHRDEKRPLVIHHLGYEPEPDGPKQKYYHQLSLEKCRLEPLNHRAWYELSLSFLRQGLQAQALAGIQKALQIQPRWEEAQKQYCLILLKSGLYAQAEGEIQKWLQIADDPLEAKSHLSTALLYQKKGEELLALSRQLLEDSRCPHFVYSNRGTWLYETRDLESAEECFRLALQKKPEVTFYREALGKISRDRLQ